MRVWLDLTNSPHVLVMRPVIAGLRADGRDVRVSARDFAQTIELCVRFAVKLAASSIDRSRPIVIVRTPPEVSLYHRFENDLFARVLERLRGAATEQGTQSVVLPRVAAQREELRRVPGFVVPEHAVDAQSLIA